MNAPYVDIASERDVIGKSGFLSTTMAHASDHFGQGKPDLARTIRPLHDGAIQGHSSPSLLLATIQGAVERSATRSRSI